LKKQKQDLLKIIDRDIKVDENKIHEEHMLEGVDWNKHDVIKKIVNHREQKGKAGELIVK
jgi:hypothetical protein